MSLRRTVVPFVAAVSLLTACASGSHSAPATSPGPPRPTSSHPTSNLSASAEARRAAITAAQTQARVDVARVVAEEPDGAAGVAAVNLTTGKSFSGGYTGQIWTASMYKLLVLETLLIQNGPLSGYQLDTATRMIENSDNAAGWTLWQAGDGNAGLTATLHLLKMTGSVAQGTDPTFTKLTPSDALKMVRALVVTPSPISAPAREQALDLMRNVEPDQRWGVGVVAAPSDDFANKNGWLSVDNSNPPGEDDDGRWVVDSVGVMTVHGQQVLMASMSMHNASMSDGIHTIQTMAKVAATVVAPA